MPEMTDAEYHAAMRQIAADYPEYFVTTDEQLLAMADDYDAATRTVAYPDRPTGRSDRQGA